MNIEAFYQHGYYVFTSPDLPELLVVSKDLHEGINDLLPSIKAIESLKAQS